MNKLFKKIILFSVITWLIIYIKQFIQICNKIQITYLLIFVYPINYFLSLRFQQKHSEITSLLYFNQQKLYYKILSQMSLFLFDCSQWDNSPKDTTASASNPKLDKHHQQNIQTRIHQSIQSQFAKHKLYTEASILENKLFTRYIILFRREDGSTQGIMSYNVIKKTGTIISSINILNYQFSYFKFDNRHQTMQICRNLIFKEGYQRLDSKISINMDNRQLKFQSPYFSLESSNPFEFTYQKLRQNIVLKMFSNFVKIYLPFISSIFERSLPLEERTNIYIIEHNILQKIYKYSDMMMVASHLNENQIETERQIFQKQKNKQKSMSKLWQNKQILSPQLIKCCNLMCRVPEYRELPTTLKQYSLQGNELKRIQSMIAMPYQPKCNNPNENNVVLNHIFIHQPNQELTKINQGGFSSIYIGQIKFWYAQTLEGKISLPKNNSSYYSPKNLLNKYAVIKIEETQNLSAKRISRNQHELKILQKIKLGSSIFLPKYYIPINDPNPFPNSVILDFIPFHNLSDFLHANNQHTSLMTKLSIMFSIIQSLRYLRDYKIVHLDLKPNNIMIYCNLLVKLIDFGQSYHSDVCKNNHKPGFTVPYSCPEIFQQGSSFTQKSDIFSAGVIFFQMLYGHFPFQILKTQPNLKKEMQKYLNYWYFSPEEYQLYGDVSILRILNNLLSKCLSVDPNERPELDWLAVVIRLCFQLIS